MDAIAVPDTVEILAVDDHAVEAYEPASGISPRTSGHVIRRRSEAPTAQEAMRLIRSWQGDIHLIDIAMLDQSEAASKR